MTQVWRVHLASDGVDPRQFCVERGIVGVGWPIEHEGPVDWVTYQRLGRDQYQREGRGWATALNAIGVRMQVGDLCWSRDLEGRYYLGRITSDWRYENSAEHREADIVNVRSVIWNRIGAADKVPGSILRHFIRGPAIRNIPDVTTVAATMRIFNETTGTITYSPNLESADLLQLLSPADTENLVALYLQSERHFLLVPRTADASAPKYEFTLLRKDGFRAAVQVKSGGESIDVSAYAAVAQEFDEFILFASSARYVGNASPPVSCLAPAIVRAYAMSNANILPMAIRLAVRQASFLESFARPDA